MEPGRPAGDDPPAQPIRRYGLGAVDRHSGEVVVTTRRRKRRCEVVELLEELLAFDRAAIEPRGTIHVAWDNASTHQDEEIEAVLCGAAGRLVLLCLPTCSPWLNPIEMLWRHFRRELTHGEPFEGIDAVRDATRGFFARCNPAPQPTRAIIGAHPAGVPIDPMTVMGG